MNNRSFLQVQSLQVRQLLEQAAGDPILEPQLQQRLEELERQLRQLDEPGKLPFPSEAKSLPRVALFLKGGGVQGSEGVRPVLAGESLIQYEKMFVEQALHDERVEARSAGRHRRRRGAPQPGLLFSGTPRGSFGLEFVPQAIDGQEVSPVHAAALQHVNDILVRVGAADEDLNKTIDVLSPRFLQSLKRFLETLAQHGAELRIASSQGPSRTVKSEDISRAADRLGREWMIDELKLVGTFRGLTRETGWFDLVTETGDLVSGHVAEGIEEEDLERIDNLTNRSCRAILQKTTTRPVTGVERINYVLIDAEAVP